MYLILFCGCKANESNSIHLPNHLSQIIFKPNLKTYDTHILYTMRLNATRINPYIRKCIVYSVLYKHIGLEKYVFNHISVCAMNENTKRG